MPSENLEKLKHGIKKDGIVAPFLVWKNLILDGHQRFVALSLLAKEGIKIPELPVVEIKATSVKDAKKKLLYASSRYAKATREGMFDFLDGLDLDDDFIGDLAIPNIDLEDFMVRTEFDGSEQPEDVELDRPLPKEESSAGLPTEAEKTVTCPSCGETIFL